jgi:hypothetical protein
LSQKSTDHVAPGTSAETNMRTVGFDMFRASVGGDSDARC